MLLDLINKLTTKLIEVYEILTSNRIFRNRLRNIGKISYTKVNKYSLSGPMSRSVGDYKDLRKCKIYDGYNRVYMPDNFTRTGDC